MVDLPTIHIRIYMNQDYTYCNKFSDEHSTIRMEHFFRQPEHIATLNMCEECVRSIGKKMEENRGIQTSR
jgi:hypothetical protein